MVRVNDENFLGFTESKKKISLTNWKGNTMRKIVINKCFGGYGLSYKAMMEYAKLKGIKLYAFVDKRDENGSLKSFDRKDKFMTYDGKSDVFLIYYATKPLANGDYAQKSYFSDDDINRDDPILVKVVEKLKTEANGTHANLKVVKIPNNVEWVIDEYDGLESVEEKHRSWN